MNRRAMVLISLRVAGYHGDTMSFVRLYTENRISRKTADEAWAQGEQQRKAGVKCGCVRCAK